MSHERMKCIKESILNCVEEQMCNLDEVDAKELGEAIDMLKDIEEALYYNAITEAMLRGDKNEYGSDHGDYEWSARGVGAYGKHEMHMGRSPEVRKMYMEARDSGKDKAIQMKELEHYIQELSTDIVEMIQEASVEERQYLEKKLLALASKIGQMK